jgi:hypothetical protein
LLRDPFPVNHCTIRLSRFIISYWIQSHPISLLLCASIGAFSLC